MSRDSLQMAFPNLLEAIGQPSVISLRNWDGVLFSPAIKGDAGSKSPVLTEVKSR
jgi:hypothetical protein